MDTLTHALVGACVAEVVATRKVGKKALVIGAIAQNIPDVDVVASLWLEPSANVLAHRGITHSFLFAAVASFVLAMLARQVVRRDHSGLLFWTGFFFLELIFHSLLDGLNAYGTAWLLPFSDHRFSGNVLFVVDPFFALPMLLGVAWLTWKRPFYSNRIIVAAVALALSGLYIVYAVYNKSQVNRLLNHAASARGLTTTDQFVTPTPFNVWLWYCDLKTIHGHELGYRSVFDGEDTMVLTYFPRGDSLLPASADPTVVARLKKFSQGFYVIAMSADTVTFNDLRFGQIGGWTDPMAPFVFHYYLQPNLDNATVMQRGRVTSSRPEALRSLVRRIRGQ